MITRAQKGAEIHPPGRKKLPKVSKPKGREKQPLSKKGAPGGEGLPQVEIRGGLKPVSTRTEENMATIKIEKGEEKKGHPRLIRGGFRCNGKSSK